MRVAQDERKVTTGGELQKRQFTIANGPHIMQVLSGLYKNPLVAIVREYLTNMVDAYIALSKVDPDRAAKAPKPILRSPTRLDPTLEFQDFGVGMDFETVWRVYSQYGNSTKNDNNDEVGGFGLGSKVAFCYNNGAPWNIIATKDGVTNRFMAFVGPDHIPQLTHVSTTKTPNTPSGVTVSIPIMPKDVDEVQKAIQHFVPYFPREIEVTGLDTPIVPRKYRFEGKGWKLDSRSSMSRWNSKGTCVILVGSVPYVVEGDPYTGKNALTDDTLFGHNDWLISVPIGSVDIVPSRDDLMYSDKTKAALRARFAEIKAEVPSVLNRVIQGATTEWEALHSYGTIVNDISGASIIPTNILWKGKSLSAMIERKVEDLTATLNATSITEFSITDSSTAGPVVHERTSGIIKLNPYYKESPASKVAFVVIDDIPKGGAGVARGLVRIKLVNCHANARAARYGHKVGTVLLIRFAGSVTKQQVSDFFGGMPLEQIHTSSELKGVVPHLKGESVENIYRWDGKRHFAPRVRIPDDSTEYYYLPMAKMQNGRYGWMEGTTNTSRYDALETTMQRLFQYAEFVGITIEQSQAKYPIVYGVMPDDIADLSEKWVNLADHLTEKLVTMIDKEKVNLAKLRANKSTLDDPSFKFGFDVLLTPGLESIQQEIAKTENIKEVQKQHRQIDTFAAKYADLNHILERHEWLGKNNVKKITAAKKAVVALEKTNNLSLDSRMKRAIGSMPIVNMMYDLYLQFVDKRNTSYYYNGGRAIETKYFSNTLAANMKLVLDNIA